MYIFMTIQRNLYVGYMLMPIVWWHANAHPASARAKCIFLCRLLVSAEIRSTRAFFLVRTLVRGWWQSEKLHKKRRSWPTYTSWESMRRLVACQRLSQMSKTFDLSLLHDHEEHDGNAHFAMDTVRINFTTYQTSFSVAHCVVQRGLIGCWNFRDCKMNSRVTKTHRNPGNHGNWQLFVNFSIS